MWQYNSKKEAVILRCDPGNANDADISFTRSVLQKHGFKKIKTSQYSDDLLKNNRDAFFILPDGDWKELSKQCGDAGLVPEADYSPSWIMHLRLKPVINYNLLVKCTDLEDRLDYLKSIGKIAAVFGNCQTLSIAELMSLSKDFADEYLVVLFPFVQNIDNTIATNGFNEALLERIDLFVTMHISEQNKFSMNVSTSNIRKSLSENCHVVIIPNSYFTAYFPQITAKSIKNTPFVLKPPMGENGLTYNDCYVEMALQNNDDTITHPTREDILSNLENTIVELISREGKCDIKISDFILSHYRERRLFYSRSHPTTEVLEELVKRLMRHLGYGDPTGIEDKVFKIDHIKEHIYPEVYEVLGLKFQDSESYVNKTLSAENADEDTYLSIFRMYKRPDCWEKRIKWIMESMNKSIQFTSNIIPSKQVKLLSKELITNNTSTHMVLGILALEDIPINTPIVQIPDVLSPPRHYVAPGLAINDGYAIKIEIGNNGHIIPKSLIKKGTELIIDTKYLF